jgi:hypothetical protein
MVVGSFGVLKYVWSPNVSVEFYTLRFNVHALDVIPLNE